MITTRIVVSLCHFGLMVFMSGMTVYLTYRTFIKANPDFDMEKEIGNGNVAVGILVAAILFSASQILMSGSDSSIQMFRMHMLASSEDGMSVGGLVARIVAHLGASMVLAVMSISFTLRLFGRLTKNLEEGKELQKGNAAVGVLLAAVVIVSSMYIKDGVGALMKALTPQPSMGRIQVLK
jgi:uncharacterized membrane protein YjfL (UPF0719 family)